MDLFDLQAKITLDTSEYEKGLNDAEGDAGKTGSNIGGKLLGAAKVIGKGMATIAAGITAVTKKSVDSFAEYEQLTGGVETLFKDSADKVKNYADEAYKTAGLSANQYMTTVTSFSAALLQGLNGDTAKAADVANTAITDMADNANKMGTSMEDIQNAYQGFAKQNYTMLDNLKLGYGGTKEEMERLLQDAEKMPEAMGRKFDLNNYADVIEAIHIVQKNMGISGYSVDELNEKLKNQSLTEEEVKKVAEDMGISYDEAMQKMKDGSLTAKDAQALLGTTAKEAATTIEGSANMTKAAWQNMITAMGTGDLEKVGKTAQQFGDSLVIYLQNLIPVIESVFKSLPKALEPVIKIIGEEFPELFKSIVPAFVELVGSIGATLSELVPQLVQIIVENLPMVINSGIEIVTSLISGIAQALPELIPAAVDAIVAITQGLLENLPLIIEAGLQLIGGLVLGLAQAIPQLLEAAPELISTLVEGLLQSIDMLIGAAGELITSLVNGLVENLPMIIESAFEIISALVEGITQNLPTIIETAIQLIVTLIEGLTQALPQIIAYMPYIIDAIVNGLVNNFGMLIECALKIVLTLVDAIANNLPKIVEIGVQLLEKLIGGILKFIKKMPETAKKLIKSFKKAFTDIKWKDIGTHILEGIANGLSKGARIIIDAAKNAAAQAFNAVCDFLGIHSPSKLFRDQVGKNMALGLADGFEDYMPYDEIEDALSFDYNVPQFETEMSVSKVGTDDVAYGAGDNITINVYATERQDERRVAEEVQKQFVLWEKQRKAVFA